MYEEFKGIGRYWNLLARKLGRAKPSGITCSFLPDLPSSLPSCATRLSKPPFYIHSLLLSIAFLLHSISLFFPLFFTVRHVVRPFESIRLLRYLYTGSGESANVLLIMDALEENSRNRLLKSIHHREMFNTES